MRTVAALVALAPLAACHSNIGPVAGATEAFQHHYAMTVAEAHDALAQGITQRYGGVRDGDDRHVFGQLACRDSDGDPCTEFYGTTPELTLDPKAGPDHTANRRTGSVVGHYWFQLYGGVVGVDGDVQIQLSGRAQDFGGQDFAIGAPGAPAWMPHEVDKFRVALDRALADRVK